MDRFVNPAARAAATTLGVFLIPGRNGESTSPRPALDAAVHRWSWKPKLAVGRAVIVAKSRCGRKVRGRIPPETWLWTCIRNPARCAPDSTLEGLRSGAVLFWRVLKRNPDAMRACEQRIRASV
jgi:hypothetical protein